MQSYIGGRRVNLQGEERNEQVHLHYIPFRHSACCEKVDIWKVDCTYQTLSRVALGTKPKWFFVTKQAMYPCKHMWQTLLLVQTRLSEEQFSLTLTFSEVTRLNASSKKHMSDFGSLTTSSGVIMVAVNAICSRFKWGGMPATKLPKAKLITLFRSKTYLEFGWIPWLSTLCWDV